MRKQFVTVTFLLVTCFTLFSCQKEDEIQKNNQVQDASTLRKGERLTREKFTDEQLILGAKLENPYSIKNMEKASKSLKDKGKDIKNIKIIHNYLYVRLLPKNESEFNKINADKSIEIFEYPLDYEIKKQGNKYKDPLLKESKYTWLYCAVPSNKVFDKEIKLEILEYLFLPFGNGKGNETEKLSKEEKDDLKELEEESMILTRNNSLNKKNGKTSDWYASGRITVWDDVINGGSLVGVEGCKVRANRWFTTKIGFTNGNGDFFVDHGWGNGNPVNYSIKWDRDGFDIRSGSYGQAYFNGPNQYGRWDLEIYEDGTPDNYIYAHVHRAAFIYYYNHNNWGLQSPPDDNYFSGLGVFNLIGHKLHIGASEGGRSHYFDWNDNWFAAEVNVKISLQNDDSRAIFGTTIHEIAHASHWKLGFTTYHYAGSAESRKLAESWAQAVGWRITRDVYGPNNAFPWNDFDALQLNNLAANQNSAYTPVFIDMMDDFDQSSQGFDRPNDIENRYNISQLEGFLQIEPTNWYGYRNLVQNSFPFPNETIGDALWLFNNYD